MKQEGKSVTDIAPNPICRLRLVLKKVLTALLIVSRPWVCWCDVVVRMVDLGMGRPGLKSTLGHKVH